MRSSERRIISEPAVAQGCDKVKVAKAAHDAARILSREGVPWFELPDESKDYVLRAIDVIKADPEFEYDYGGVKTTMRKKMSDQIFLTIVRALQ